MSAPHGIELLLAPALEPLTERLVARVRARRAAAGRGAFEPVWLLAPGRALRTWLQLELSRRSGIAANLRWLSLDELLLLQLPPGERANLRALEAGPLARALLHLLGDDALLAAPELAPLAAWLGGQPDPDARDRRRVQLATRLAARLIELAPERPELLEAWRGGRGTLPAAHPDAAREAWQARLWREALRRLGPGCLPLPDLVRRALDAPAPGGDSPGRDSPDELLVLAPTRLPPLHRQALAGLARRMRIALHLLQPGPQESEPRATRRWTRVAHAQLAGWQAAAAAAAVPLRVEATATAASPPAPAPAPTLLHALQARLRGQPRPDPARTAAPDGSLRLLACPDPWREAEAAAGEVWRALDEAAAAGRPLRFSDVSVVLAARDPDPWRAALATVFRRAHGIPLSVADALPGDEARLLEAARLLIELPLGELSRGQVLRVATHPAVAPCAAGSEAPEEEVARWLDLVTELGVRRGADRADLAASYLERDLGSWDQGLRRLALGAFAPGPRAGFEQPLELGGELYLPCDQADDEVAPGARFGLLLRALLAEVRAARGPDRRLSEWGAFLARLVSTYLVPDEDDEEQEALRARCARALRALGEDEPADARPVSYRVAAELALLALAELRGRAHDLADGVVVSGFGPGRPVPFPLVIVLGLGEGELPRPRLQDELDLLPEDAGAAPPASEELDAAAFLELVGAARERLVLSWVARDPTSGAALAPSSLVRELERLLEEEGLVPDAGALVERVPLDRDDPQGLPPPFGRAVGAGLPVIAAAWREGQARALREDLEAHLGAELPEGVAWPGAEELRAGVEEGVRERVEALLAGAGASAGAGAGASAGAEAEETITVAGLAGFLESPLQAWGKRLGLREAREADPLGEAEEPWSVPALVAGRLLRRAFCSALCGAESLEALRGALPAAWEAAVLPGELGGQLPTGTFLEAARRAQRNALVAWCDALAAYRLAPGDLRALRPWRFGAAWEEDDEPPPVLRPALSLAPGLRLVGRTGWLDSTRGRWLSLVAGEARGRHLQRGLLELALLRAAEVPLAAPCRLLVIGGQGEPLLWTVDPPEPGAARAHLALLAADLLGGPHAYLLPGDVAWEWILERARGEPNPPGLAERIRRARDDAFRSGPDAWGPVPRPGRFEPAPEAEALALRRLGPLAGWVREAAVPAPGAP